jgi:hypothetical protein
MAFEPFGYRFDIRAPMRRDETTVAIRTRLKTWFDPKEGARGWSVGPFLCLWSSALNRQGPMVLALVTEDGFSTRIRGRAGSDLNGTIWFMILFLFMALALAQGAGSEQLSLGEVLFCSALFVVLVPLILWHGHSDRHEANHLVRFLNDAVMPAAKSRRMAAANVSIVKPLEMVVSGEKSSESVTGGSIYEALLATGLGDFIILASASETYIQALGTEAGLIIEMREGNADRHFRAVHCGGSHRANADAPNHFSFEEAWDVLVAYVSETPMPSGVQWEREQIELNGMSPVAYRFLQLLPWLAGIALIIFFVRDIMRLFR